MGDCNAAVPGFDRDSCQWQDAGPGSGVRYHPARDNGQGFDMRRLVQIPLLIAALVLIGTIGLHLLTEQSLMDCFYQSIILVTTVGCREPAPLTDGTKLFIVGAI